MTTKTAGAIFSPVLNHRATLAVYPDRQRYANFGRSLLEMWEKGMMDDLDFRKRLCALAFCNVEGDDPIHDGWRGSLEELNKRRGLA